MKIQNFELSTLEYDEALNILFLRVKEDIVVDVNEITEMIAYVKEFMGTKKHLAVIDFGTSVMSSSEARDFYANSEYIQKYRIADAFLVKSLSVRLVANFFIQVTQPKVKTKLFNNEKDALDWLMGIQKT